MNSCVSIVRCDGFGTFVQFHPIWQRGFGTTHNAGDLDDWQANFGAVDLLSVSSAVPEASTLLLAAIGLPVVLARRGRRRAG